MVPDEEEPEDLPPYIIENARSGRSKCKTCRKTIPKDELRLGVLVEGPFGAGHMWHHLNCAAGRWMPKVEEAYEAEAWTAAKVPPSVDDLPDLASLRELAVKGEAERAAKEKDKKVLPYAEIAPSDRSKCKQSGEPIPKGSVRIVLGKEAQFGNQTRTSPYAVLPEHVDAALAEEDIATDPHTLVDALRANSKIDAEALEEALGRIGDV